jgi:hypothetical protein
MTGEEWEDAQLLELEHPLLKVMFVLTISITIIGIFGIVQLFGVVRFYQNRRSVRFDELIQLDKIDYLIHLFEESENIYKLRRNSNSDEQENLDQFLELLNELSDQLDELHGMAPDVDYRGRPREKKKE